VVPGGSRANLEFVAPRATFPERMDEPDRLVLADAQTNGGMLAAVDAKAAPAILGALADAGAPARAIGEVARLRRGEEPGIDVGGEISAPFARQDRQEKRR
jgi:selenide,water dikinase